MVLAKAPCYHGEVNRLYFSLIGVLTWGFLVLFPESATGVDESAKDFEPSRCELIPLPGNQVSFQVDGVEKTRWHFGLETPRPFFYPFHGPSGVSLTRMGHPGAENHDHHRSIWFAHHDVNGFDFWSDQKTPLIKQVHWYAYEDGNDEAIMAAKLLWTDPEAGDQMEQELVAALRPLAGGEQVLEIQLTLRPPGSRELVELAKTNFGFLAVRMAKSLSHHFGGGQLTNSEGGVGEEAIFGKPARWVDYSGPVPVGEGPDRKVVIEGITYFDHPGNPRYPTSWHVRSDGWMGASFCFSGAYTITREEPLVLRYLLHAHGGAHDDERAAEVAKAFAERPGFVVEKSGRPHRQYEVRRISGR